MIKIEELRKKMGLSQEDLAKKINMTQQRISAYEKGKREPDLETLKLFADFFNVTTDYLLGKSNIRNPEEHKNSENLDITHLTDENKQILQATYQGLLAKQDLETKSNNSKEKNTKLKNA